MSVHAIATDHCHAAAAPSDIPAPGWKDVLLRTFKEVGDDRVTLIAGGVTYFLLLALFPALTALVSIYGLMVDPATVIAQVDALSGVVPAGGLSLIHDQLTRIAAQGTPTLGLALAISLGLALWSASSGVKALFDAMNIAYDETERRNFFVLNGLALLFTLAGVVGAGIMLTAVVAIPAFLTVIGLDSRLEWLARIGGYVVMLAALVTGIAALYRYGPSRQAAKWRWITPGAILAVLVIAAVSLLFSWYAANIGHFDQTYGSLGALIAFLFWMWVCLTALIVGAELNSELEHQTTRDSTTGAPRPLGQRGAVMADRVATAPADPRDPAGTAAPRRGALSDYPAGPSRPLPLAASVPLIAALFFLRRRAGRD